MQIKHLHAYYIIFCIAIMGMLPMSLSASQSKIVWLSQVAYQHEIRIKDLVDLQHTDGQFLDNYGDILVSKRQMKSIDTSVLSMILERNGLDLSQHYIKNKGHILIVGGVVSSVCEGRIKEKIQQAIVDKYHVKETDIDLNIHSIAGSCHIVSSVNISSVHLGNDVDIKLEPSVHYGKSHQISARADIAIQVPVVIAKKIIAKNTLIKKSNLMLERREIKSDAQLAYRRLSDFETSNMVASMSISQGQMIVKKMLSSGIILKKGDLITMITKQSGLQIHAVGRLLADAGLGQTVMVENIDSKKQVIGRVLDIKHVEVVVQ